MLMIVDVVVVTHNREKCIVEAIESILVYREQLGTVFVIVNGSTDNTLQLLQPYELDDQVEIIVLDNNLGAPAGKNIGMRRSDADLLVIFDDDAVFFSDEPIKAVKNIFEKNPDLGIVQFKIVNYDSKKIQKNEFPGDDPETQADTEFLISSFTGAGHAIRKSMLDAVGYYPDSFFYGHEELDLSFRAVNSGWLIKYFPDVGVYHKKSPKGRLPEDRMIEKMVVNRMIISYSYLPLYYRLVSGILWLGKALLWSRSFIVPMNALRQYRHLRKEAKRQPVGLEAMKYLKENYGRLWY